MRDMEPAKARTRRPEGPDKERGNYSVVFV